MLTKCQSKASSEERSLRLELHSDSMMPEEIRAPNFKETQMTAQPPNSSPPEWKCTGLTTNRHPEAINKEFKCKYCERTYKDYLKENQIAIGQRILLSSSGMAAIAALLLLISAGVYARQKFAEADRAIRQLEQTKTELAQVNADLKKAEQELETANEKLQRVPKLEKLLADTQNKLESTKTQLQTTQYNLTQTNQNLTQTKHKLQQREQQITEGSKCVKLIGEINNVIWEGAALNPDGVMRIQQTLQSVGFYQGEIDGILADSTRKSIENFQRDCQAKLERQ